MIVCDVCEETIPRNELQERCSPDLGLEHLCLPCYGKLLDQSEELGAMIRKAVLDKRGLELTD